jgi:hypothetical protein
MAAFKILQGSLRVLALEKKLGNLSQGCCG